MKEFNLNVQRRIAAGNVANQSLESVTECLLQARKRAYDAEARSHKLQADLDALKAAHAWIKTSERLPADDARVLALVVDDTGTEQVEIVNFVACIPAWRFDSDDAAIDDEIVTGWMPLPGRMR